MFKSSAIILTDLRRVDSVFMKASLGRWWTVLNRAHSSRVTAMPVRSFPLLQEVSLPPLSLWHNCSTVRRKSTFLDLWVEYERFSSSSSSLTFTTSACAWEAAGEDRIIVQAGLIKSLTQLLYWEQGYMCMCYHLLPVFQLSQCRLMRWYWLKCTLHILGNYSATYKIIYHHNTT